MRLHNQIAHFTHRACAAGTPSYIMGVLQSKPMRFRDGDRQSATHHHRQIDNIVADKGTLMLSHTGLFA